MTANDRVRASRRSLAAAIDPYGAPAVTRLASAEGNEEENRANEAGDATRG